MTLSLDERRAHYEVRKGDRRPCAVCSYLNINVRHDPPEIRVADSDHSGVDYHAFHPVAGAVSLEVARRVTMAEIATWHPSRIDQFFAGIAMTVDAVNGQDVRRSEPLGSISGSNGGSGHE